MPFVYTQTQTCIVFTYICSYTCPSFCVVHVLRLNDAEPDHDTERLLECSPKEENTPTPTPFFWDLTLPDTRLHAHHQHNAIPTSNIFAHAQKT